MEKYKVEDIDVIDDPIPLIRRRPDMYIGGAVPGPRLAAMLVNDLALLDRLPVQVARDGDWWVITAGSDWLRSATGEISTDPFFRIVLHPDAGLYAIRSEVVLTALAAAVVTSAAGATTWISGADQARVMPKSLCRTLEASNSGRIVAFRMDADCIRAEPP